MKQILLFTVTLLVASVATGQVDKTAFEKQKEQMTREYRQAAGQARQQYDEAKKKAQEEYAAFRKKANEEYAAFMQQAWERMTLVPGEEPPVPEPKPRRQPKAPAEKMPSATPLPHSEVAPTLRFALYDAPCQVHTDASGLRFRLKSIDERGAAEGWKLLSQERYDGLLHDCLAERDAHRLGDWGYLRLLQAMSEQLLGKGSNEAVLLQMYLLTQSGYAVRLAKADGHLALLVPFSRNVYTYSYLTLNGQRFYLIAKSKGREVEVFNMAFPREKVAGILMAELPRLGAKLQPKRTFTAERFGTLTATVGVDKSLIDFMNDYPVSDAWDCYALTGLSEGVKADLYPMLRGQIKGKSQTKAATMLLDFVQTAFQYATDQEQFGYERPLFGDESFHYPKNDCEDRSILFSILVRDLLGLDVVLVHWPGHMATAVAFPGDVDGDYFTLKGKRYTVCDPTFIGAGVGETMPQFKGVSAKLVTL